MHSRVREHSCLSILIGAKLLTPFGLFGKAATRGFRRRLAERYGTTGDERDMVFPGRADVEDSAETQGTARAQERIDMTQFLLDYVLDMGPALDQRSRPESPRAGRSQSNLEQDEVSHNTAVYAKISNDSSG